MWKVYNTPRDRTFLKATWSQCLNDGLQSRQPVTAVDSHHLSLAPVTAYNSHPPSSTHCRTGATSNITPSHTHLLSVWWSSESVSSDTLLQYTHPFNGPLSRTIGVSRYQKGRNNLDFTEQETVSGSGSGISWVICKSAPRSRQITTPAPHHSVSYRPDALPVVQPTVSKHWRQNG